MMCRRNICAAALTLAFIFLPGLAGNAWPQPNIEQASKEVTRQDYEKIEEKLIKPPSKPPQVKEELEELPIEGPTFNVKSIELTGVTAFSVEDFKPLTAKYENKDVNMSALKVLAKEIERDYLRRGVIAACFIPPQDVKEGKVTLRIVEAKMGNVEIGGDRWFSKKRVENYWTIPRGEIIRYDEVSRILQLMNKNPDKTVKAALRAGEKPETTDVLLDMQTNFPAHLTATMDHEGAPSTGKLRRGAGFVHNNFLGLDDTLIGGYMGSNNFDQAYVYHMLPVTYFGTSVLYGYSKSKSFPQKDYAVYELNSMSESYSMYLYQDIFYKDEYRGEFSLGIDANNKRVVSGAGGTLNADRLRVLSAAISLTERNQGNTTTVKPAIYQGINGLGARRNSEFSSRDAGNVFTKAMLNVSMRQAFVKNFMASLKFTGQIASEKLMPQQELYLGGMDSVRGYPSGDYLADTGFYSQMELLVPAFFVPDEVRMPYGERPIKDEITGVAFFDCGYGYKRGEIEGEQTFRRMASLGLGVRAKVLNQATMRLEVGVPLNPVVDGPLTEWDRSRIHFSVDFQDDLPEEMERFRKVYREEYIKEAAWRILNAEMQDRGSPLARAIYSNLYYAKSCYDTGKLEDAKKYYAAVANIANSVYRQTVIYLTENYNYADELRRENEAGSAYFRNGEIEKASEVWQRIVTEAKPKPLVLEFI